jgi:DNA-binding response OmpR family regulator
MRVTTKILLIEDNPSLQESLGELLGKTYDVDYVSNGQDGIKLALVRVYDVIVLDLGLPDMSGHEVCKAIRKHQSITPILILTAATEFGTRVRLLDSGADDYMVKPFNVAEFRARLRALVRRGRFSPQPSKNLKVANLTLNPTTRRVERGGKYIELRRKEFDILEYMMRNRGKVITRSMIIDNVWSEDGVAWNNTINVHVKHLRDKIDRPFKHKLIKTAYGLGYTISDRV